MEVWQQRVVPSAFAPPAAASPRQARFLGGLFATSPEVSSQPSLMICSVQEDEDDPLLDEGLDPAKFFALSRGGGGPGRGKKRRRRRKRPGMRAAGSSYGKRKVLVQTKIAQARKPRRCICSKLSMTD